jgi:hypothetical protein
MQTYKSIPSPPLYRMATPIMTGNPAMQQFLQEQYRRQQQFRTIFEPGGPITKREAHARAFQALLAARQAAMEQQRR